MAKAAPAGGACPFLLTGAAVTGDGTAGAQEYEAVVRANRGRAPDAALCGRYRARGIAHDIYVVRLTSLCWQVLDVTATEVVIVDTLDGFDDRFEQARALARDYVPERQTHHEGRRENDPLPRRSGTAPHSDSARPS